MTQDTTPKKKIDWNDPEQRRAYHRERSREFYKRNKERLRAQTDKWQEKHPDAVKEAFKRYYEKNKEAHLAKMAEYHRIHRDKLREQERARRARRKLEKQRLAEQQAVDQQQEK